MNGKTITTVTTESRAESRLDDLTFLIGAAQSLAMEITESHDLIRDETLAEQINAVLGAAQVEVAALYEAMSAADVKEGA